MLRPAAAALLALGLVAVSACDSHGDGSSALVGTWAPVTLGTRVAVTVDQAQPLIDLDGPTTGALRVTGQDPALFTDPTVGFRDAEALSVTFEATRPGEHESLTLSSYAETTSDGPRASSYIYGRPHVTVIYRSRAVPLAFALDGATIRVPPTPLESDSGRRVELSGEITLASRPLAAGERAVIWDQTSADGTGGERVEFLDGGRLRLTDPGAPGLDVREGTWSVAGDVVRLQAPGNDRFEAMDVTYTFRRVGQTLELESPPVPCDVDTIYHLGGRRLLVPGTIETCHIERTQTLAPPAGP